MAITTNMNYSGFRTSYPNTPNYNNNITKITSTMNYPHNPIQYNNTNVETLDLKPIVDYSDFNTKIDEKVQGLTETKNFIYVSSHHPADRKGSRIYVYDKNTGDYKGFIRLDHSAHVGGLAYDEVNDVLYVTGSGNIYTYNNQEIEKLINSNFNENNDKKDPIIDLARVRIYSNNQSTIFMDNNFDNILDGNNAASIYFNDGLLYMVTCDTEYRTLTAHSKYKVIKPTLNNGKITYNEESDVLAYLKDGEIGKNVQGLAVTDYKDGNKYLFITRSMGMIKNTGQIDTYRIDDDGITLLGTHYTKEGIQGISVDNNYNVTYISEWGKEKSVNTTVDDLISDYDEKSTLVKIATTLMDFGYDKMDIAIDIKDIAVDNINVYKAAWELLKNRDWDSVKNFAESELKVLNSFTELKKDFTDDIKKNISALITNVNDIANGKINLKDLALEKMEDGVVLVKEGTEKFNQAVTFVENKVEDFADSAVDKLEDFGDAVSDKVDDFKDFGSSLISKIPF